MESAIQTVVKVFLKSSKGGETMNGGAFDSLVKKQLGNVLTDSDSKIALKEMRKGLDDNQDGKVSFPEYMKLIGYLATSMSDEKTNSKEEVTQSPPAAAANSAPAQENNKTAEPAKDEEKTKEEEEAQPEPVAAAVAAAPAVPAVVVEGEKKPEEVVEEASASSVAEGEVKSEETAS